ncbi:hypothetical protein ABPG74_020460 [Tetrahymena malaccensis]
MSVNFKIIPLVCTPILVILIIGIASQIVAYNYLLYFIQDYTKNLMQDQIIFTEYNSLSSSIKIGFQAFQIPYYLTIVNNFYQKLLNGLVNKSPKYIPSIINFLELNTQSADYNLLEMYKKDKNLLNCWFYKNYTMTQLQGNQIQGQLQNATFLNPLFNSIMKSNSLDSQNILNILNFNISFFFYSSGLFYSTALNLTTDQLLNDGSCGENGDSLKQSYECYSWFAQANQQKSSYFSYPYRLDLGDQIPFLGQFGCQKLVWYNSTSKQDELYHTFCYQIKISDLYNFNQQQNLSQLQLFSFETTKNLIIYDSSGQNELSDIFEVLQKLYNFDSKDIEFVQNFTTNYQQIAKQTFDYFILTNRVNMSAPKYYQKQINGSSYSFIYNPIFILDKINGISSSNQNQGKYKFILHSIFIQIISDNNLQQQANKFQQFTKNLFLAASIIYLILIIFFAFIAIYYSLIFNDLIQSPIEKMTQALIRLHSQKNSQNFLFILNQMLSNNEDSIFPKEIYDLTISLQQILQILLSVSENYFENDQAETLIRLYRNIYFFKSSKNYYALGITHNNIGVILANQGHYQHSLEHYQQSIIYAKYEIQDFCRQHRSCQNYEQLLNYCYDDDNSFYIQQLKNQNQNDKSKNSVDENQQKKQINQLNCITKILEYLKNFIKKKQNEQYNTNQKKLNTDEQESIQKFVDLFGNSLIVNDENGQQDEQLLKDENYYQSIQLLLNLYYRKVNYNFALIWFQTNIDKYYIHINKNSKFQNNQIVLLNFWQEIKKNCKEINALIKQIGLTDQQKIMNINFLRICYSKLNKQHKIEKLSEEIATLIQRNKQQTKISENLLNSHADSNQDSNLWLFDQNLSLKFKNIVQQNEVINQKLKTNSQENVVKQQLKTQFNERSSSIFEQQAKLTNQNLNSNQEVYGQFLNTPKLYNQQRYQNKNILNNNQQKIISNLEKLYNNQISNKSSINENIDTQIKNNDNYTIDNLIEGRTSPQNQFFQRENSPNFHSINKTNMQNIQSNQIPQKQYEQKMKQQNIEKKINNFQSSNSNLKEKIKRKYDKFFRQQMKNQISFEKSQMALENMITMSKITFSDILVKQNKYLSAALLLTDIVENSKFFLSHTVQIIYNKLKEIFEYYHIYCKQLDQMLQSLNKNVSLQVIVIFNTSKNHNNWMHTFFIVRQLFQKVLTQQQDRFGSIQIKQDEYDIMESFRILPIKLVKSVIHIFFNKFKEKFFDINQNLLEKSINFQNKAQESFQQKMGKEKQQQKEKNFKLDINSQFNNDMSPSSEIDFLSSQQFNNNPIKNNENKMLDQNKFKKQKNNLPQSKLEGDSGEIQESDLSSQNDLEEDIDTDNLQYNQGEIIKQNTLFHFSIRKALKQFLDLHKITFKGASQKYEKTTMYLDYVKKFDEKLKYQFTKNQHLQISKQHIIFSTYSICNNFLERQEDLKFIYNDQEVIRIFYEKEQLINFMNSKRNNNKAVPHVTFVQHY